MKIGQKLILVAEGNFFTYAKPPANGISLEAFIAQGLEDISLCQIEVSESKEVLGTYTGQTRTGYRAEGSDGWVYVSQWNGFDDASSQPYKNWQREYLPGVHYTLREGNAESTKVIDKFLCSEPEFFDHYLNWELTSVLRFLSPAMVVALTAKANKQFPECETVWCDVPIAGSTDTHSKFGVFYKSEGCYYCDFLGLKHSLKG